MLRLFRLVTYIFAFIGFVLVIVYLATQLGWTNSTGIVDLQHDYFKEQLNNSASKPKWTTSEEWSVLKDAILKDKGAIDRAANETGTPSRLIVSILIVEQLRLFHSNREIFKSVFAPLKVLGNQSQFSWGVMGIKQDTAKQIEANLQDKKSPWYLGDKYSRLIAYASSTKDSDNDAERFMRLTDEDNRYFSYLYGAILIKEIEAQWSNVGFPISNRPDILATLFNIGFANSRPNAQPQVGGAEIEIDGQIYSFGGLAGEFYRSDELIKEFPK